MSDPAPPLPPSYDALLLVSFGGPEGPQDVMPFLEDVVRGKDVPRERLLEVARHYERFGGVSPAGDQIRGLLFALVTELNTHGPRLPVYWGNLHGHPSLRDAIAQMADDGVRRALAFVTSGFGSYPSCGRYVKDIASARENRAPRPRRSTSSDCSTIIPALSRRRPIASGMRWNRCPPSVAARRR